MSTNNTPMFQCIDSKVFGARQLARYAHFLWKSLFCVVRKEKGERDTRRAKRQISKYITSFLVRNPSKYILTYVPYADFHTSWVDTVLAW